ncbi:hypothetical protein C8J57DRAFT_1526079 [Mycena rebaudengoi]|nr:hypothetical protein C8J57DRAFT_1526079 [Mycena rebaudengoi]
MCLRPLSTDTSTIAAATDESLHGPTSNHHRYILGYLLPTCTAPLLLLATTAPPACFFTTPPFRWLSGLPNDSNTLPNSTLTVPPRARHSSATVMSLPKTRFAVVYSRGGSYVVGDPPYFDSPTLKFAGSLTHASYRPPRSQCLPSTRSREIIAQYYDLRENPGSLDRWTLYWLQLVWIFRTGPYRVSIAFSLTSWHRSPGLQLESWYRAGLKRTGVWSTQQRAPCTPPPPPPGLTLSVCAYIAGCAVAPGRVVCRARTRGTTYGALPHPLALFRYSVARTSAWVESAAADATDEGTPLRPSPLSTRKIVYARPDVLPLDSAPTRLGREPSPP